MPPFSHFVSFLYAFLILLFHARFCECQPSLPPSETKAFFRIRRLLQHPPAMSFMPDVAGVDLCSVPPTASFSIACFSGHIISLSISGNLTSPLSDFSSDALFTTLPALSPNLSSLSLVSLGLRGPLPSKLDRLSSLQVLNLSSNFFSGNLPPELSRLTSLQRLVLSNNSFNGTVPDLSPLVALTELDLSNNGFGHSFPSLNSASLVRLDLKANDFRSRIPESIASFKLLQHLDLSDNKLVGQIPPQLFSLPAIQFLSLANNRLAGQLPAILDLAKGLSFVNLSSNFLTGPLPAAISYNTSTTVVINDGNCFTSADQRNQHPTSYCSPGAIAAVLPPPGKMQTTTKSNLGAVIGIVGGTLGGVVLLVLLFALLLKRVRANHTKQLALPKQPLAISAVAGPAAEEPAIHACPLSRPADKRHASQAARISVMGIATYREFTLAEIDEMTNNFNSSNLLKDSAQGKSYRGWLQDGAMIVVSCLKFKQKFSSQLIVKYMEILPKLRHRHLVSVIGHCIVYGDESSSMPSRIYLVSESISNGSLRSHLTEWRKREMLKWPQRVTAAIGIARGIKYLHTVTVPGIVRNDLNIENALLDQTLTAKLSNYNLPMLTNHKNNKMRSECPFVGVDENDVGSSVEGEKEDIYQLGLIFLEIITGKPPGSKNQVNDLKCQLREALADGSDELKELADTAIRGTFAIGSLKTVTEITLNCLSDSSHDRPSIDDILWNLQYSVQIQEGWASNDSSSFQSLIL